MTVTSGDWTDALCSYSVIPNFELAHVTSRDAVRGYQVHHYRRLWKYDHQMTVVKLQNDVTHIERVPTCPNIFSMIISCMNSVLFRGAFPTSSCRVRSSTGLSHVGSPLRLAARVRTAIVFCKRTRRLLLTPHHSSLAS